MGSSGGKELTVALRDRLSVKILASTLVLSWANCSADTTAVGCGDSGAAGASGFRIRATTAIAIATTERNMFSIRHRRSGPGICFIDHPVGLLRLIATAERGIGDDRRIPEAWGSIHVLFPREGGIYPLASRNGNEIIGIATNRALDGFVCVVSKCPIVSLGLGWSLEP